MFEFPHKHRHIPWRSQNYYQILPSTQMKPQSPQWHEPFQKQSPSRPITLKLFCTIALSPLPLLLFLSFSICLHFPLLSCPCFSLVLLSLKKKATLLFICLCSVCGAQGPPQNSLLWLFCLAQLQYSRGNTIMSQLHMVSEADKQNNLCFVCVLLRVLCEPCGAAVPSSSCRTDQRRSQAPCHLSHSHPLTHTHPTTTQGTKEDNDQAQRTLEGTQGRWCGGQGGGEEKKVK